MHSLTRRDSVPQVFLDVSSMIDYNVELLNRNDLSNSFFQLDKQDPTVGFPFNASTFCGPTFPPQESPPLLDEPERGVQQQFLTSLEARLILGSHLANYLRRQLEENTRYTATVGISTSKLLAKLVGNVNKPRNQTTLIPPYSAGHAGQENNVSTFLDQHEIGKIPGIGSKMAKRIRAHVLRRQPDTEIYHGLDDADKVTVGTVRSIPGMNPSKLEDILRGGGWPRNIGTKTWSLLNGIDNSEVAVGRAVPSQISIEDSFGQLDNIQAVRQKFLSLSRSLIRRMHTDLIEDEIPTTPYVGRSLGTEIPAKHKKRWLAHPRTLRLSTRSRLPPLPDGSHQYHGNRMSRSTPMPQFVFSSNDTVESLAERLVEETIMPLFRKLHPPKSGYKLSLLNLAATNMVESAGTDRSSVGQDIGKMFQTRGHYYCAANPNTEPTMNDINPLDIEESVASSGTRGCDDHEHKTEEHNPHSSTVHLADDDDEMHQWASDDDPVGADSATITEQCTICNVYIPRFAAQAHALYHYEQE